MFLEPVCCQKLQKKSPNQETSLGNREPLEALIDTKLILNDQRSLFRINLVSVRASRGLLLPKLVSWFGFGIFFCCFLLQTGCRVDYPSTYYPIDSPKAVGLPSGPISIWSGSSSKSRYTLLFMGRQLQVFLPPGGWIQPQPQSPQLMIWVSLQ